MYCVLLFMSNDLSRGKLSDLSNLMADDGDELHFCSACAFSAACIDAGYDKQRLAELHCLVEHVGPYQAGGYVFRTGDPFRAIFAVRGGMVKTVQTDTQGEDHVLGFYLPGEIVGLNAIYPEHFPCDAVVLDTTYLCRFSFPAMSALASRMPVLQQHLFRLLSKELGTALVLAGDHTADQRMAAFLVDLGRRFKARGFSGTRFRLSMSRADMASHLRLAAETVSRVLGRFRNQAWIRVDGREVELINVAQLDALARPLLDR